MSVADAVPVPSWVKDHIYPSSVDHARLRFLIRLAALYHNESGSLTLLADACNLSMPALHMVLKRGAISPEIAIRIEKVIGREHFPREIFRPDLFTLPAA